MPIFKISWPRWREDVPVMLAAEEIAPDIPIGNARDRIGILPQHYHGGDGSIMGGPMVENGDGAVEINIEIERHGLSIGRGIEIDDFLPG
jgi:hypothetical protein